MSCLTLHKPILRGPNCLLSIVAIHGLNGHSEKTWTAGNDVNWLRKFLPIDVPNARIFSYGYEAKTHAASPVSQLTFPHHAEELVGELCRKRKNAKVRDMRTNMCQ